MDKIYRLDLLTLIENLQQQSATLTAELPAGSVPGVFEECKGFVRIRNGEIIKSAIIGKSGPQVSGPNALKYLRSIDRWLVSIEQNESNGNAQMPMPISPQPSPYTPFPISPVAPPPAMYSPHISETREGIFTPPPESLPPQIQFPLQRPPVIVPHQRIPLPEDLLHRLSPRERMVYRLVFTMINGHRSIDQIKEQLHLTAETIDQVLNDLHRQGVIDW